MKTEFLTIIKESTGANDIRLTEVVQELWSGYGSIVRYELEESAVKSVVVKHISFGRAQKHPRGWNTDISHQRKLKSYRVEQEWYQKWSDYCSEECKVPECLAIRTIGDETLIILKDFDESDFMRRSEDVSDAELYSCLKWLANFHATFMGFNPDGLWEEGTYWHLETRPDELEALADAELRGSAEAIDNTLKKSAYRTFLHGDAKLANFCFNPAGDKAAAVDFQYVGGGCGMKDVAYFIGSCLSGEEQAKLGPKVIDHYFSELSKALGLHHPKIDSRAIEDEWRELYPFAIADFQRFLKGWSPRHWKENSYAEGVTRKVLNLLSD